MIQIAHRGNINGPHANMENRPEYLQAALDKGFDVKCDVWFDGGKFMLGYEFPTFLTNRQFFQQKRVWTHCRNASAFIELVKYTNINCFFQENDDLALTSRGQLWAHPKCLQWDANTVLVNLDKDRPEFVGLERPYGICSDFIKRSSQIPDRLPFDLLIADVDGVMTDGTKLYDREGKVSGKRFCDVDFTTIKRFRAGGIKVCFLSGDENINRAMAETRKVPFFHSIKGTDKVDYLEKIKMDFNASRIAYVGDDYYDISIMSAADVSFCPKNSPISVKRAATVVLPVESGHGVLAAIYDMYDDQIPYSYPKDLQ